MSRRLRQLCMRDGLAACETLCVGDARSDVEMAGSCGMPVVVVLTGALDRKAAGRLGVDGIVPSLASLPGFLRKRYGPPGG